MAGTESGTREPGEPEEIERWAPGDRILWRYRGNGTRPPGDGRSPGGQRANGERPADGGRPANGEHRFSGGQLTTGEHLGSGGYPGNGGHRLPGPARSAAPAASPASRGGHRPSGVSQPYRPDQPFGARPPSFPICRPVTVVQDSPDLLAAWMAPGTECVKPVLADGTDVHAEPLATRYTAPRIAIRSAWSGTGVLKLARPGEPWSVWLFWDQGWRFRNWYVNLEEPHTRWSGGIDSEDHFLDIAVRPDRSWHWLDEDEFAQAQRVGLMDPSTAERVREAGRAAVETIRAWGAPFRDGWEDWRPDPRWRVPSLPDDWDRTPAHMPT